MYITFVNERYLFLLLLVPLFILIHIISLRTSRKKALRFANFEAISKIKGVDLFSKNITITFLSILIFILLIFSLSGITLHTNAKASSFSFVLAIDSSRSMEANDFSPNRIGAAKQTSLGFVDASPRTTKIGIVSFSGNAYIEQDITENRNQIKAAIEGIEISPIEGTDIGEVVITSTNLLKGEPARAIILLSDGQMTVGALDETVEYANENDIMVHSLAIGTEKGGITSYGTSKLDEESLRALSYNTGGKFFIVEDTAGLIETFNNILNLTERKVAISLAPFLILAAVILFILEFILLNLRYRIFP